MSNSNLVNYTKLSPNYTKMNNKVNKKITIHHMAGNLTVEGCGEVFQNKLRKASSNYGIGSDGRVGLYVEESNRAWTSSNRTNDSEAVTIEVANNTLDPTWTVSEAAFNKLIDLCVDICMRNGIRQLVWTGDSTGTLTCHYMFTATLCPGPYLKSKMSEIAQLVNARLQGGGNMPARKNIQWNVRQIYDYFRSKGLTDAGVSGLLGNLQAESGIRSNNLQNSYEKKLAMPDVIYTNAVNTGVYTKEQFVNDKAGYGLAQWTFWTRKEALYNYAMQVGHTIDSTEMQCQFLFKELCEKYKGVLNVLVSSNDIRECSNMVLMNFEKPKDQSINVQNKRYEYSVGIYNNCCNKEAVKVETSVPKCPFLVKVETPNLNVRESHSIKSDKRGKMPVGTFTIVEVQQGEGSKLGWGKLKSGIGWISLDYVTIKK